MIGWLAVWLCGKQETGWCVSVVRCLSIKLVYLCDHTHYFLSTGLFFEWGSGHAVQLLRVGGDHILLYWLCTAT
jgi:hypothetical protein